jgi:hypothetical protein
VCADMWWPGAEMQVGFKLDPTMFSNAEKQQLPMERCMRILPHQQVRQPLCWQERAAASCFQRHRAEQHVSCKCSMQCMMRCRSHGVPVLQGISCVLC